LQKYPATPSPVVDAITTLVGRWVTQDAARVNAAQAATRMQHHRREIDDVNKYLDARQRMRRPGTGDQTTRETSRGTRTPSP
jgi:hypothetical protein